MSDVLPPRIDNTSCPMYHRISIDHLDFVVIDWAEKFFDRAVLPCRTWMDPDRLSSDRRRRQAPARCCHRGGPAGDEAHRQQCAQSLRRRVHAVRRASAGTSGSGAQLMAEALDEFALARWRSDPCSFITECLRDGETGRPFVLLPCERTFFEHAYKTNDQGRLVYPEQCFAA